MQSKVDPAHQATPRGIPLRPLRWRSLPPFCGGALISALSLSALVACITIGHRAFAKLRFGPVYSIEWLFIIFSLGIAIEGMRTRRMPAFSIKKNAWLLAFTAWCAILIAKDAWSMADRSRLMQHALIVVYPMLWINAGAWVKKQDGRLLSVLTIGLFVLQSIRNAMGLNVTNFSVGPLAAIPLMILIFEIVTRTRKRWIAAIAGAALSGLAFFPFWRMLTDSFQRTSVLQLIVTVFVIPLICSLRRTTRSLQPAVVAFVLGIAIFSAGMVVQFPFLDRSAGLSAQLLKPLTHGEDTPQAGNPEHFQSRVRRFLWTQAILDWSQHPVIGIGFIPELPSFIGPGSPNQTDPFHVEPGAPPINGPHNSFLTILARTGAVGFILFTVFLTQFLVIAAKSSLTLQPELVAALCLGVVINGLIYSFFNVGFESPHNAVLFWLYLGILSEPC